MNDPLRRAFRTFVQAALGIVLLQAAALLTDLDDGVIDEGLWMRVGIAAAGAGFIAVVTWLQNALEEAGRVPKLLK